MRAISTLRGPFAACVLAAAAGQLAGCAAAVIGAGAAAGAAAAYDRRSTGTFVDDEVIELKTLTAIQDDPELSAQGHISTTSYNNMVLISGEVPSEALRDRAGQIVKRVPKVRGVYNELKIAAPSSLLTRSSDTVITGKVKTALLADPQVEGARVKVVTENGTVYLLGLVTHAEADRATEVARRVSGVQRVVRLFEFLN